MIIIFITFFLPFFFLLILHDSSNHKYQYNSGSLRKYQHILRHTQAPSVLFLYICMLDIR